MLALAAALTAFPAATQVTVVDGDTIKLHGTTYRLWGIDAPESKQSCADGWPAGKLATEYMTSLVRDHTVTCEPRGNDVTDAPLAYAKQTARMI